MKVVYPSGEDVREGDHVRYLGEVGTVEFVVTDKKTNDQSSDWYTDQFPGGGVMITNETFGRVFLSSADFDGHLEFVSRREEA